jgi:hypothetical protein
MHQLAVRLERQRWLTPPAALGTNNPAILSLTRAPPPVVYNNITSLFDKSWDLSQKADQSRWMVVTKADKDHKRFDVSVATTQTFMELVQDKGKFYCWSPLMCALMQGDGAFDGTTNTLANSNTVMKINFLLHHDLLTKWTLVLVRACQLFAHWFNGNDAMRLNTPFGDHTARKVVSLDCNAAGNVGLIRCYKVQLRIINQLVLHCLKNHLTATLYKSFRAHKVEFSFIDKKTGNPVYSGLILL